jgi:hypothetical protein
MTRLRLAVLVLGLLVAIPVVVSAGFQTQRDQIDITITINVTPAPIALRALPSTGIGAGIVARLSLNPSERPPRAFRAENLVFELGNAVAQSQGSVKVEAEISPNPNATMLYGNNCQGNSPTTGTCSSWTTSQTAGTTQTYPCAYEVVVDTTVSSFTLDDGLYTNFEQSGGSGSFAGGDVANNTYVSTATPQPTATPFLVYTTDGGQWAKVETGGYMRTYCVDLTVTIPSTTAQGTYSSNAVYTLYY